MSGLRKGIDMDERTREMCGPQYSSRSCRTCGNRLAKPVLNSTCGLGEDCSCDHESLTDWTPKQGEGETV